MRRIAIMATLLLAMAPATAHAGDVDCEELMLEPEPNARQLVSADYFQYHGVVNDGANVFTWYSENVLPGKGLTELNANGRMVDESGYVVDGDGYIAVASPWGVDEIGTVIETPFGLAKVYDACEDDSYDVYTSW